jgi:hypothetical protein
MSRKTDQHQSADARSAKHQRRSGRRVAVELSPVLAGVIAYLAIVVLRGPPRRAMPPPLPGPERRLRAATTTRHVLPPRLDPDNEDMPAEIVPSPPPRPIRAPASLPAGILRGRGVPALGRQAGTAGSDSGR